jgi:hypothetical protein
VRRDVERVVLAWTVSLHLDHPAVVDTVGV